MSLVGFKAKNHGQQVRSRGADDGVDERITPASIFDPVNALHRFTLDAAANQANARCSRFFSLAQDGLKQPWAHERVWCNPPYSNLAAWTAKAVAEVESGECPLVVMLLPANRCEQRWWQENIEHRRDRLGGGLEVRTSFLAGRPRFGWPAGRVPPPKGDRPPFGLVLVTFAKRSP